VIIIAVGNQTPAGQFWGGLIEHLLWVLAGSWVLYGWPRSVNRKLQRGQLTEDQAQERLRKLRPQLGYIIMLVGIGLMFMDLWQVGMLGYSKLLALVPAGIAIGVFIFWLRRRNT